MINTVLRLAEFCGTLLLFSVDSTIQGAAPQRVAALGEII